MSRRVCWSLPVTLSRCSQVIISIHFFTHNFTSLKNVIFCRIFGHEGEEAEDIIFINWLSLILNGATKALEMYQPQTETWLQVIQLKFSSDYRK